MIEQTAIKLNWAIAGVSAILAILLLTVAKACPSMIETAAGGSCHMSCHYTVKAGVLLAVIAIIFAAESALRRRLLAFTNVVLGVVIVLLPSVLGICAMKEMACHTSALCMRICGVVIALIGIIQLLAKGEKDL